MTDKGDLTAPELSAEELAQQGSETLPARESLSTLCPDPAEAFGDPSLLDPASAPSQDTL